VRIGIQQDIFFVAKCHARLAENKRIHAKVTRILPIFPSTSLKENTV
jgi:uncharacterized protein YtpQ (UPF0354 family)